MQPEIDVLGLSLKTFGIFFALCFAAWGALAARRLRELGKPVDWAYEMVFVALAGGLVGARAYHVLQNWDEASDDLLASVFSGSGLVWYGGLLGGAVTILAWAWRRGFLGPQLLDICGPGLALGYAVGRIGCQISGDGDYGTPSDLPWAMAYPDGEVPTTTEVHPTPIYESLAMGTAAWFLWRQRDRVRPGLLLPLYFVLAGVERFLVEFVRRNDEVWAGLTAPQLESVGLWAAGVAWLAVAARRGGVRVSGPGPGSRSAPA